MIAASQAPRVASQREVARRLGLSHTALQKAQRSGRIAPEADGLWDIDKVRTHLAASSDPARQMGRVPPAAAVHPPPPPRPAAPDLPSAASFHSARTANEVLKAQERKLRLEERRGQLVDKARTLLLVNRLAREERDAILAWPSRCAGELAAELSVDAHRLQTLLEAALRTHLSARAVPQVTL